MACSSGEALHINVDSRGNFQGAPTPSLRALRSNPKVAREVWIASSPSAPRNHSHLCP